MTNAERSGVRDVVCQLLDCMRNAHLRMVLGDSTRTMEFLNEADQALVKLGALFKGDPVNEALAGRVLFEVIAERQASLRELVRQSEDRPLSSTAVVEFVEQPLRR